MQLYNLLLFVKPFSMRKRLLKPFILAIISLSILSLYPSRAMSQGYEIKIQIKGFPDTIAYMSYFYGAGQFYRDTTTVDKDGKFTFSSEKDTLEHGMYSVLIKDKKVFDFLVNEQRISFQSDTNALIPHMKVKGSPENEIFFDYLKYLDLKNDEVRMYRRKIQDLSGDSAAIASYQSKIKGLDKDVKTFIANLHKEHPGSFTSNFIYALEYPTVPEAPEDADSTFGFKYFKAHFFDNFAWDDERLLRTSTFQEKIDYYIEKLTLQDADSIIKSVDYILGNLENNLTTYKYTLSYLTSKYERSQIMGMDAVFVHLAKEYFIRKRPDWFSDQNLKKLVERANALDPLLIGKKAPNIIVKDTAMKKFLQLYEVKSKYTVVYIWSPDCGHCKEATPKLKVLYDKYRDKGLEVFAVGNEFENEEWIKFINKHNLDWINGSDGGDFRSNFRGLYDVYSTPQTYLLDENKKILSKKMTVESLERMLEYYYSKDSKEKLN